MSHEFQRILVAVDLSSCSRAALELASRMAIVHRATVHVLHVTNERSPSLLTEVHRFVASALHESAPKPEVRLASGLPRDAILATAEDLASDVIVLGTHGRTGRARMLAGSVAESVVRGSSRPVITVREQVRT